VRWVADTKLHSGGTSNRPQVMSPSRVCLTFRFLPPHAPTLESPCCSLHSAPSDSAKHRTLLCTTVLRPEGKVPGVRILPGDFAEPSHHTPCGLVLLLRLSLTLACLEALSKIQRDILVPLFDFFVCLFVSQPDIIGCISWGVKILMESNHSN